MPMSLRNSCSVSVEMSASEPTRSVVGLDVDLLGADDVDLRLLERRVELVELGRLEVELVEREGDFLGVELAGALPRLEQRPHLEQVEDACGGGRLSRTSGVRCAQTAPFVGPL